ncbi:MAG: GNVR domain-containing protein, partial [Terriglobales bacterium]
LEVRRAAAAAEVSRLSAIYRPQAAPLQQARQQLASLDASLAALRDQARQARARALAAAQLQVQNLREQLARQAQRQAGLAQVLDAWDLDQRQLHADQTIYTSLLDQLQQASAEAGAASPPLRIADPAVPPLRPLRPNLFSVLGMAVVLGCALAAITAWGLEATERRLRWPEAGELGVPLVAFTRPGESLEPLAATVLAAQREFAAKVVLMVSAGNGVAASAVTLELARTLSPLVPQVLVLESQCPAEADAPAGLAELLAGQAAIEQVLQRGSSPGEPDRLLRGAAEVRPGLALCLAAGAGAELLTAARARYELVLINAGPVLEASEPCLWAGLADCTLVVADATCSPSRVRRALDVLEIAGAPSLGLILNRARPPRDWFAPPLASAPHAESVPVLHQRAG